MSDLRILPWSIICFRGMPFHLPNLVALREPLQHPPSLFYIRNPRASPCPFDWGLVLSLTWDPFSNVTCHGLLSGDGFFMQTPVQDYICSGLNGTVNARTDATRLFVKRAIIRHCNPM